MRTPTLLLSLLLAFPCGCKKDPGQTQPGAGSASAPLTGAASAASAAPAASSAGPGGAAATLPAKRKLDAGKNERGTWTPSFELEGQAVSEPQSFEQALAACKAAKLSLCTETQWTRACEADSALGKLETPTLSMDGPKVVTRGGESCASRALVGPKETGPSRGLVCCTRAVGIETDNQNDSFLRASAERVRGLEAAMTAHDGLALEPIMDDKVLLGGKETPKDQAVTYYKTRPDSIWSAFDVCEVKIDKENDRLLADCRTTTSTPATSRTLVVFGGPKSKIQLIGPPESLKLLPKEEGKEQKERVRSFIQ